MTAPLLYFELAPPPDLAGHVLAFWGFEVRHGAAHTHTLWPDASLSVTWGVRDGRTAVLGALGARTEPMEVPVHPGDSYRGIRFRPDSVRPLFDLDPRCLKGARLPVESLGGTGMELSRLAGDPGVMHEAFARFESAIRPCVHAAGEVDALVRRGLQLIDEQPERSMRGVAAELGISDRQMRRRFADATGLSPKEYARIRRLRHAMVRAIDARSGWSTIAAASGFADQAHLVNEIVRMTNYTPRLLQERLRLIEHVGITP
jgi:AraC-like DNA-binding protein